MKWTITYALLLVVPAALAKHHEPDAVAADPDHYTVEAENDTVRVLRIKYGAGETSTMHKHPATCAIYLTDGTFEMTMPDGETATNQANVGGVECRDAQVHNPKNVGDGPSELILIEFKDKPTFEG